MILYFPFSPGFDSFKYLDEALILQSEITPHLLSAFPWISIIFPFSLKKPEHSQVAAPDRQRCCISLSLHVHTARAAAAATGAQTSSPQTDNLS